MKKRNALALNRFNKITMHILDCRNIIYHRVSKSLKTNRPGHKKKLISSNQNMVFPVKDN